ncbi:MAG TPA: OadG family protein [Clostridiales bacterium]|nr:OadG family protein [Clostridiales bacterium]
MSTFSEIFGYGLIVTLVGVGMCFIVLIGLAYMLSGLKIISNRGAAEKKTEVVRTERVESPKEVATENIEATQDENELVAVISAALAAFMGRENNLVVRSIRRVEGNAPVWAKVGRQDQMYNRL